jgi:hypothetical protein
VRKTWLLEIRSQRPGKPDREDRRLGLHQFQPSPVGFSKITRHCEAQPGAGVAAHRAFEDPSRKLGRDPGSLIADFDDHLGRGRTDAHECGAVAMHEGVLEQRREDLRQPAWAGEPDHRPLAFDLELPPVPGEGRRPLRHLLTNDAVDVQGYGVSGTALPRLREQSIDDVGKPLHLGDRR